MQEEIQESKAFLNSEGVLTHSGWAKSMLPIYNRKFVHFSPLRIKEWDFYEIRNSDFELVLVVYDVGYQGKIEATWIDFHSQERATATEIVWFSKGKFNLPPSSDKGNISIKIKNSRWECILKEDHRVITFNFPNFNNGDGFSGKVKLLQPKDLDSIVNIIPFKNPKQFVFAQKINCMQAIGEFRIGDKIIKFTEKNPSFACLDWTRAVFPYRVEWWWASASGLVNEVLFGLNIDYGFGKESSKNMIFYNKVGHHLDEVTYSWNPTNITEDWLFTSNDNRIRLILHPTYTQNESTNFYVLKMQVVKVFGYYSGEVILDSGVKIIISESDRLFGHAEYAQNRW